MVDQVEDVPRSWIKKLLGFSVLKPSERSAVQQSIPNDLWIPMLIVNQIVPKVQVAFLGFDTLFMDQIK